VGPPYRNTEGRNGVGATLTVPTSSEFARRTYLLEVAHVAREERQACLEAHAGDERVRRGDRLAARLEVPVRGRGEVGGVARHGQDGRRRQRGPDAIERAVRGRPAARELVDRDRGDGEIACRQQPRDAKPGRLPPALQRVDEHVGVNDGHGTTPSGCGAFPRGGTRPPRRSGSPGKPGHASRGRAAPPRPRAPLARPPAEPRAGARRRA